MTQTQENGQKPSKTAKKCGFCGLVSRNIFFGTFSSTSMLRPSQATIRSSMRRYVKISKMRPNQDFGYVSGALNRENDPLWEKLKKHLEIFLKGSIKTKNTKIQPAICSGAPCEGMLKSEKSGFWLMSGALNRENGLLWEKLKKHLRDIPKRKH